MAKIKIVGVEIAKDSFTGEDGKTMDYDCFYLKLDNGFRIRVKADGNGKDMLKIVALQLD